MPGASIHNRWRPAGWRRRRWRTFRPQTIFRNLFEVPVLFYVVCCALAITDLVTPLQLSLAWGYVALRAAHSLIHVTYNRVTHRFVAYALSTLDVFAMWGVFTVSLLRSSGS